MIRINKNESPLRPLTADQLTSIIQNASFNFYPDEEYERFKQGYAHYYNLSADQIIAGNGSDELIQKLMLIMPEGPALTLNPDFFMYQAYANQVNRPIAFVDADINLSFNLESILSRIEEVQPAFFIMSNPHNPSGKQYSMTFLTAIADKMKSIGGYFVIDEAYLDFGDAYTFELQPHVIQMRTLSKAFGIAGLRLGVLISTPDTIQLIQSIEHPYPLNTLTLHIAIFMFEHIDMTHQFIDHQRVLAIRLRQMFLDNVNDLMMVFPSSTNFVLTKGPAAQSLGRFIEDNGFLPRRYEEPNMNEYVRYSIATDEQLDQLEQLIKSWRSQYDISKEA
ncbi:pyridoxal phosphate-dependent aminotransferase [Staphylococcus edaphicus]|uniref:Putative pyridoxal phosphate-dependent acyltransferase n=1 Tax=Staphylococcus edaphicus TaxID=1955013 RepID=A0A2C6WDP2_9STAP|nr:histidinol-phosphate transaminase [Staphylococcus edaphicus]PHK48948.1 histidinol-phosphate aminotransferase [Staphylococcus edaphicus]UQW81965.1 histidinol-phosphate aminotransferase family protein [Staphylococcus edaphicus]